MSRDARSVLNENEAPTTQDPTVADSAGHGMTHVASVPQRFPRVIDGRPMLAANANQGTRETQDLPSYVRHT